VSDWREWQKSLKLDTFISLTNFKYQLSEQLTDHCSCTQSICMHNTERTATASAMQCCKAYATFHWK
jgi:hypothetical protein